MGPTSHVQLTLKERVREWKYKQATPRHVKQIQNEAALKSDVVLNVFRGALTKAFSSGPELLKHPIVLYRISAYITEVVYGRDL